MADIRLDISYERLSEIALAEVNLRKINILGATLQMQSIIFSMNGQQCTLLIEASLRQPFSGKLHFTPIFDKNKQSIELSNLSLLLHSPNKTFQGFLNLAKPFLRKKINKFRKIELSKYQSILSGHLDDQLASLKLPHEMQLKSKTRLIRWNSIDFQTQGLFIDATIDQDLLFYD